MSWSADTGRVLVLAPHPDDEVLGCGGTIARLSDEGREVHVAIMTSGRQPRFAAESVAAVRAEAQAAHQLLGVAETHFGDLPAAELDTVAHADLNAAVTAIVQRVQPTTLFIPFIGDLHLDHKLLFRAALVAARPRGSDYPARILAYETLSETNWLAPYLDQPFTPNVYLDISTTLDRKIAAFRLFASQCREFPDERSPEALTALARSRGATVHLMAAEAFVLIREVG